MDSFETAVFDLDGTLLNTLDDLTSSTNYALSYYGLPTRTTDEVRRFVGNGILNLIRRAVPVGSSQALVAKVHDTFDAHYARHNLDQTAPYPGVLEAVGQIRTHGVHCCVVSNKGDYAVQPLVRHFFPDLFDVVVGEREKEGIRRKPWPDTVLACLQTTGCLPSKAVYVGDSEVDVQTAANANMPCLIVTWGFRDEEYLRQQGARHFAHTTNELVQAVLDGFAS